jgi:hypothetical protein
LAFSYLVLVSNFSLMFWVHGRAFWTLDSVAADAAGYGEANCDSDGQPDGNVSGHYSQGYAEGGSQGDA